MADQLLGKVALVTGGASGIGRAIALRFARAGAIVVIADEADHPAEGGEPTRAILDREGRAAMFRKTDLTSEADAEAAVSCAVDRFGRLDVLVTTATVGWSGRIAETSLQEWQRTLGLAVTGMFLASRAAVRQMCGQTEGEDGVRGRILAVGCPSVTADAAASAALAAAKAAVHELARRIAIDHGADGIVCNVIDPGVIVVQRSNRPEEVAAAERAASRTAWRRAGRPEDVANAALFLASDEASFISGAVLAVDGGLAAH